MRQPFTLALVAVLLAFPVSAWGQFQKKASPNPLTDDQTSLFYHEFFDLPDSATTADSVVALRLPPSRGRHYVYFTGTIQEIEPISKARFPFCYEPDSDLLYSAYWKAVLVRIEVDSVLAGECPGGTIEAVAKFARTTEDPGPFGWKAQLMHPGAEIAGLLLWIKDPRVRDLPTLHGSSIFVFSSPHDADRLDDFRGIVTDLFRRVGTGAL